MTSLLQAIKAQQLSDRQRAMLAFIERYQAEHRRPPTVREIGEACSISSTSVVDYNLGVLTERGYLVRDRGTTRGRWLRESGSICEACGGSGRIEASA